mmetsp:Transcript_102021/g.292740  ORF Transcript_102021/g.292740 Transcript_102021/m.292740 type:complete len:209 (-) Transcript_102021:148-774(-)
MSCQRRARVASLSSSTSSKFSPAIRERQISNRRNKTRPFRQPSKCETKGGPKMSTSLAEARGVSATSSSACSTAPSSADAATAETTPPSSTPPAGAAMPMPPRSLADSLPMSRLTSAARRGRGPLPQASEAEDGSEGDGGGGMAARRAARRSSSRSSSKAPSAASCKRLNTQVPSVAVEPSCSEVPRPSTASNGDGAAMCVLGCRLEE